jgi:hypothetical protein
MPKPVDSLQELVTKIGAEGKDTDGALETMAKGMTNTLTMLTSLCTALLPLTALEKAAQDEIKTANTEGAAKSDTDPGKNDDANKPEGTDVDDTKAGYTDMSKGRAMPAIEGRESGEVDVTAFLHALWGRFDTLEKAVKDHGIALAKIDRSSSTRDQLVGEAIQNGFSTLAMGMVETHEMLTKIPASPSNAAAIAAVARGDEGKRVGQRLGGIGGRLPSGQGGPVALDDAQAQGASGLTTSMMMKAYSGNIVTEDHVRIWKKTGRLSPDDAANADLVQRVKNASSEAAA